MLQATVSALAGLDSPRFTFLSEWKDTCPTAMSPDFYCQPQAQQVSYLEISEGRVDDLLVRLRRPEG